MSVERVKLTDGRTLRLEIQGEDGLLLRGFQVDAQHARVQADREHLEAAGASDGFKLHLVDKALIVKRTPVEIDHKYGTEKVS